MVRYKHYKGGIYEFIGEANHTENGECLVIYKSEETGKVWARPYDMFHGLLEDGTKRFTLITS